MADLCNIRNNILFVCLFVRLFSNKMHREWLRVKGKMCMLEMTTLLRRKMLFPIIPHKAMVRFLNKEQGISCTSRSSLNNGP